MTNDWIEPRPTALNKTDAASALVRWQPKADMLAGLAHLQDAALVQSDQLHRQILSIFTRCNVNHSPNWPFVDSAAFKLVECPLSRNTPASVAVVFLNMGRTFAGCTTLAVRALVHRTLGTAVGGDSTRLNRAATELKMLPNHKRHK